MMWQGEVTQWLGAPAWIFATDSGNCDDVHHGPRMEVKSSECGGSRRPSWGGARAVRPPIAAGRAVLDNSEPSADPDFSERAGRSTQCFPDASRCLAVACGVRARPSHKLSPWLVS